MEAGTTSLPNDDPLSARSAEKPALRHVTADSNMLSSSNGSAARSDASCEHDAAAAQPMGPSRDPAGRAQHSAVASTSSHSEGLSAPAAGSPGGGGAGSAGGTEAKISGGEGTKQARTPHHKHSRQYGVDISPCPLSNQNMEAPGSFRT